MAPGILTSRPAGQGRVGIVHRSSFICNYYQVMVVVVVVVVISLQVLFRDSMSRQSQRCFAADHGAAGIRGADLGAESSGARYHVGAPWLFSPTPTTWIPGWLS